LFFILLIISSLSVSAQTLSLKHYLPVSKMPWEFRKQIKIVNEEFKVAYDVRFDNSKNEVLNYKEEDIRKIITTDKEFEKIFRCPFWIAMDSARYCKFIPELIMKLTDTTTVGLSDAGDVTIWCRVKSKQLKQNSLNYQIDDDAFRICGRASWILKRLTKNEFGIISCNPTKSELIEIQKKWIKWFNNSLKVK